MLLPSYETHGHHKAVALITLDAVNQMDVEPRSPQIAALPSRA
ncbi:MAG TPA: hypothetical protein VGM43_10755 [Bryobacteraceae bacterium]|jgi:hypothetical protein